MGELIRLNDAWMGAGDWKLGAYYSSFDHTTPEGRRQLYRSSLSADVRQEEWLKTPFPTVNIVIRPERHLNEETGELDPVTRLVAFDAEGFRACATGEGVLNSLRELLQHFGPPPWSPPLKLRLVQNRSAKGYNYYSLDLEV